MFVFIPPIVDTFGGWHKDSLEVISKLRRYVSSQQWQRVAVLLVRDHVNIFDLLTPFLPQAVDVDNVF